MRVDPGKTEIRVPWMTRNAARAIDPNILADITDTTKEPITQAANPHTLVLRGSICHKCYRLSEPYAKRHREGAGAEAALLSASVDQRLNLLLHVAADV